MIRFSDEEFSERAVDRKLHLIELEITPEPCFGCHFAYIANLGRWTSHRLIVRVAIRPK